MMKVFISTVKMRMMINININNRVIFLIIEIIKKNE